MLAIKNKLLILLLIVAVIPLLSTLFISYSLGYNTLLTRIKNQLESEANQRGIALEQINDLRIQELNSFAVQDNVQELVRVSNTLKAGNIVDNNVLKSYEEKLKSDFINFHDQTGGKNGFDNMLVFDKTGKVVFSNDVSKLGKDFSADKLFAKGIMNETSRYLTLENGTRRVQVTAPIRDLSGNNSVIGIITASTSPYFIDEILLNRKGLGNTGESYLVNSDMTLITPSRFIDGIFTQKVDTVPVRECFKDEQNSVSHQFSGLNKHKNLEVIMGKAGFSYSDYRYVPVFGVSFCDRQLGYVLLAEIDQQEALAPILYLELEYLLVGSLIIVSVTVFSYFISKKFVEPIQKLSDVTKKVAGGNLEVDIPKMKNDEIGMLGNDVKKMKDTLVFVINNMENLVLSKTNELNEVNTDLVNNQIVMNEYLQEIEKFKNALDEASLVAMADKSGTITYANQKFCDVSKYRRDELLGKNHRILKSGYHSTEFYQDMWNTISRGKIWRGEIKNKAKDGSYYWVQTIIMPIIGKDGKPKEYLSIRTDITGIKEISEKLELALIELQQVDNLKDEFLAMISHELRTPLIPILGYCEMMLEHGMTGISTTQSQILIDIQKNAKRIQKMINDILLIQKLEMNQIRFEKQFIDIDEFLESIRRNYNHDAWQKNIEIVITVAGRQIIQSDPDRLAEVFANLIHNAIDFMESDGKIEIGAKLDYDKVVFFVKDNGIGIPKEKQGSLFKKFYQVDTSLKRRHQGTGLGLSICKEIIERMNGKIWVESEEGRGTTFYFMVPRE